MALEKHKQEWEELGAIDPLWAVLTDPAKRHGKWNVDEFFRTGEELAAGLMKVADQLGHPKERRHALDFGCGVGRVTRGLAKYFERCSGVDISSAMLAKARELNAHVGNCEFLLNVDERLSLFEDEYFDLVYTGIVLQHVPSTTIIQSYISEFVRTLRKGGLLVFQLPSHISLRNRLQLRRRVYALLRAVNVDAHFLLERMNLAPVRMNFIPEQMVTRLLSSLGARILLVRTDVSNDEWESKTYFVSK